MPRKLPTFIIKLQDQEVYYLTTGVLEYDETKAKGPKKEQQLAGVKKVKDEFHQTTFHNAKVVTAQNFTPLNTEPD